MASPHKIHCDLRDELFWQLKLLEGPEPWGPHGKISDWQLRFVSGESFVPSWKQNVKSSSEWDGSKKTEGSVFLICNANCIKLSILTKLPLSLKKCNTFRFYDWKPFLGMSGAHFQIFARWWSMFKKVPSTNVVKCAEDNKVFSFFLPCQVSKNHGQPSNAGIGKCKIKSGCTLHKLI